MLEPIYLFLIPLLASAAIFFLPIRGEMSKQLSIVLSLAPLLYLLYGGYAWIGADSNYSWLPPLQINFHLHVDQLALAFLYLTAIIIPIALYMLENQYINAAHLFCGLILLVQALLFGFFMARDLVVFTFFWEAMLLPLFFIINLWGGPKRRHAAIKFLVYMFAGSLFMVAAVLGLYAAADTFDMDQLAKIADRLPHSALICAIFLLAFAVKTPLFPFHAWLPDAYYQAPLSGTILLSALLSKAGIFGFLRIGVEFFPQEIIAWSTWLIGLAIAGVFYGAFAAWTQNDFKRLIAYSSLSHVNFILIGVFVLNVVAQQGAILQAFNHGITITALFILASWLEERLHTTQFGEVSGLAAYIPYFTWLTLFFVLASIALPGLNNFVGEFLILFGLFSQMPELTVVLTLIVVFSAVYMLRWMQRMFFETPNFPNPAFHDLRFREWAVALPLAAIILWLGIYPAPFFDLIRPAAERNAIEMEKSA